MSSIKLFESRLKKEGSVLAAKCSQLKMQSADGIETVTTCHALKMVAPDRRTRQTQSKSVKPVVTRKNAKRPGIIRALKDWPHIEFVDDRGGNQFRVILKRAQLPDGGVNGGVNVGVNELLDIIRMHPGLRAPDLAKRLGLTSKNIERWIKQLRDNGTIEFVGTPKTGGYHCL